MTNLRRLQCWSDADALGLGSYSRSLPSAELQPSGECDRLLHARNRGMESFPSLPDRGSGRCCGTSGAESLARRKPRKRSHFDHRQWHTIHLFAVHGDVAQLGITHRRTAYHHPEGNSYIERFHRSLKEEEVWTSEYRSLNEARENIGRYLEEYNHDRPHRGVENRTLHEAYWLLQF